MRVRISFWQPKLEVGGQQELTLKKELRKTVGASTPGRTPGRTPAGTPFLRRFARMPIPSPGMWS